MAEPRADSVELPRSVAWLFRWFSRIARGELRKSFAAIRCLEGQEFPELDPGRPVVVYLNHPSWWDPLVCIDCARRFLPERRHFGPIDQDALDSYPLFKRLGFFGIDRGTRAGARRFLEVSTRVCREPSTALWMTPEGHFRDASLRPVELSAGLSRLAQRLAAEGLDAQLVPLALCYGFWDQKRPELFLAFGAPVEIGSGTPATPIQELLRAPLESLLDDLASAVRERSDERMPVLEAGRRSVHPIYEGLRRVVGTLRGRRSGLGHQSVPRENDAPS